MTLCPYCHDWLSLCRCPVGFFPTQKSIGTNPGETQFAGEKDCSTTEQADNCRSAATSQNPAELAGDSFLLSAAASIEQ